MLTRCEETNFILNWEKCHFMVKEGILLRHKVFKSSIEVDKGVRDTITKTSIKRERVEVFSRTCGFLQTFYKRFFFEN